MDFSTIWALAVVKAWKEPKWKEAFKNDPAGELEKTFGYKVPSGVKLVVREVAAGQPVEYTMMIPPLPKDLDALGDPEKLTAVIEKIAC
jgi:hypothetical protein